MFWDTAIYAKLSLQVCEIKFAGVAHLGWSQIKMAFLIRLSIFQLRNKIFSFNMSINPSFVNEETYKIKTKFKSFLNKTYLDFFQNRLSK